MAAGLSDVHAASYHMAVICKVHYIYIYTYVRGQNFIADRIVSRHFGYRLGGPFISAPTTNCKLHRNAQRRTTDPAKLYGLKLYQANEVINDDIPVSSASVVL